MAANDEIEFNEICEGYEYIPSVLPAVERIIVIGDLHGDWNMTIESLKVAKVIDNNLQWIGGKTHVVQVGDQVDQISRPAQAPRRGCASSRIDRGVKF